MNDAQIFVLSLDWIGRSGRASPLGRLCCAPCGLVGHLLRACRGKIGDGRGMQRAVEIAACDPSSDIHKPLRAHHNARSRRIAAENYVAAHHNPPVYNHGVIFAKVVRRCQTG
jgi:hypothetical protein